MIQMASLHIRLGLTKHFKFFAGEAAGEVAAAAGEAASPAQQYKMQPNPVVPVMGWNMIVPWFIFVTLS